MITKFKRKKKRGIKVKEDTVFQVLFFLFALILIGFLAFSILRIHKKRTELAEEIEFLEKEIQTLEEQKNELETGISETEKESYWEEKIREQGYVKEGETPVVVMKPSGTEGGELVGNKSFSAQLFEKIKDFFFSIIQR